ncbi:hypothetical protein ABZ281_45200, partial [Streptomyces sp. NPDC006265]|uniref:hypothetical protein n=1 Tax=Streptomyces sp. NPDC006265 TaxID=3156740 RepID=UPI0033B77F55
VRVYLPPDANTLLSVADHALRSRDYVNVIVAGRGQDGRSSVGMRHSETTMSPVRRHGEGGKGTAGRSTVC